MNNIRNDETKAKTYKIDLKKESLRDFESPYIFPKYTTQIINLANQNSGGTRPNVVGQMSELIQECPDKSLSGWREWYIENHPDAIQNAKGKIIPMILHLQNAIISIDDKMVEDWVTDLIIYKTAEGLIIQEIILRSLAEKLNKDWRIATIEEESKNIDGYIGEIPVQIKPDSYKSKKSTVQERIDVNIIYYKKTEKYLTIETDLIDY